MTTETDWWERVAGLADMVRHKADFLADPGCDVDHDGIASELSREQDDGDALLSAWFDHVVGLLGDRDTIVLHRHQTVEDVDAYVAGLREGSRTVGYHWSLDEDTSSPHPDQYDQDIMMRGRVGASQVEWFSTFQAMFSHPWELQVYFEGFMALENVREIRTGRDHDMGGLECLIAVEEAFAPTP